MIGVIIKLKDNENFMTKNNGWFWLMIKWIGGRINELINDRISKFISEWMEGWMNYNEWKISWKNELMQTFILWKRTRSPAMQKERVCEYLFLIFFLFFFDSQFNFEHKYIPSAKYIYIWCSRHVKIFRTTAWTFIEIKYESPKNWY